MLIFRGDRTVHSEIASVADDSRIILLGAGTGKQITSYFNTYDINGKPTTTELKKVKVGKELNSNNQEVDIEAIGLYLGTNKGFSDTTSPPTVFIRAINCAFIVTRFMIIFIERDPTKDAIIELINSTFEDSVDKAKKGFFATTMVKTEDERWNLANPTKAKKNSEIKLSFKNPNNPTDKDYEKNSNFDSTNLENQLAFLNNTNGAILTTNPTNQINKYIKIHDKDKGKRNYLMDFSTPTSNVSSTIKAYEVFTLKPMPKTALESTELSMSFERLVDIFKKSILQDDDFDLSGDAAELDALQKKNEKLKKAIDESKKYLIKAKSNLEKYNSDMPSIK